MVYAGIWDHPHADMGWDCPVSLSFCMAYYFKDNLSQLSLVETSLGGWKMCCCDLHNQSQILTHSFLTFLAHHLQGQSELYLCLQGRV